MSERSLLRYWFSSGPRIGRAGDGVVVSPSCWEVFWGLGAEGRRVVVSAGRKTITIHERSMWVCRSVRVIPFKNIISVGYGYRDLNHRDLVLEHDEGTMRDRYSVGVNIARGSCPAEGQGRLVPTGHSPASGDEYVELAAFRGPGGRQMDLGIWDDWELLDLPNGFVVGEQGGVSRQFAELLAGMTRRRIVAV